MLAWNPLTPLFHLPFLTAKDKNFVKHGLVHCIVCATHTRHVFSFLETTVMMHPYLRLGMGITQITKYSSTCNALSHFFLYPGNDVPCFIELPWKHVFQRTSGLGGTHKCEREMWRFDVVVNLCRGDSASYCCSWNSTSSNAKTFSHLRFGQSLTCHTIEGIFGQSSTHFILLPLMQGFVWLAQNQK